MPKIVLNMSFSCEIGAKNAILTDLYKFYMFNDNELSGLEITENGAPVAVNSIGRMHREGRKELKTYQNTT